MDLLKKELERKKQSLQRAREKLSSASSGPANHIRFVRQAELRRFEEEDEQADNDNNKRKVAPHDSQQVSAGIKRQRADQGGSVRDEGEGQLDRGESTTEDASSAAMSNQQPTSFSLMSQLELLHPSEISNRLRMLGLPVQLFGERTGRLRNDEDHNNREEKFEDSQRLKRLHDAVLAQRETMVHLSEKEEFRLGQGHGIRNPFLDKARTAQVKVVDSTSTLSFNSSNHPSYLTTAETNAQDDDDDQNDPQKRIYKYFKGLLRQWEEDLSQRPDETKQSIAGQNETKTFKQCKDYIRPLFKLCKTRKLEEGLVANIALIVDFCQQGEFVQAHDVYMDVAIGRSAWPIGVTMVGIHARTGRAKIESKNVAHVMNSELQRKYLTSVKRLMTYAQSKRPDVEPSKKVVN